ncbi:MAG: sigma-70 family RNA polymerase sigma factor [Myxococcaceae bacterium]
MSLSIEVLYEKYGPMVLRRCRRLLRDESKASDAMHDVFVQLLRHQGKLSQDSGSSLLYRLATNVCLNRLRTERRHPEDRDDELVLNIAHDLDLESRANARSMLAWLFQEEPESSATIAVMHFLDGMSWEQVAQEVGMSVSGVRKRSRALGERLNLMEEAS